MAEINRVLKMVSEEMMAGGSSQTLEVESIMIEVNERNPQSAKHDIMNLSPTFNKRTPTRWTLYKEPERYIKVSLSSTNDTIERIDA